MFARKVFNLLRRSRGENWQVGVQRRRVEPGQFSRCGYELGHSVYLMCSVFLALKK